MLVFVCAVRNHLVKLRRATLEEVELVTWSPTAADSAACSARGQSQVGASGTMRLCDVTRACSELCYRIKMHVPVVKAT